MSVNSGLLDEKKTASTTQSLWHQFRWVLFGLPFVPAAVVLWFAIAQPVLVLPRQQLAPGFMLTNQDGVQIDSEDFRGKLVFINMTYTNCLAPDCVQTTDSMAELYARMNEVELGSLDMALITMSIDPARDDTAALAAFAERYGSPPGVFDDAAVSWDFAGSDSLRVMKTIVGAGYRVYFEAGDPAPDGSYAVDFKPQWVLVDGWGTVRGMYGGDQLDVDLVLRDLAYLIDEIERSTGTMAFAYEAAHLFRCYP